MESLLKEEDVKKVLAAVDKNEVVNFCRKLIQINSVSTGKDMAGEGEIAVFLADKFREWGWSVDAYNVEDGRPNVIATIEGSEHGPSLMYNGHTDVVAIENYNGNPFVAKVQNGRIYGRGASDMKGGLTSVIMAANALWNAEIDLRGDLVIACVIDEEGKSRGTRALAYKGGPKTDFGVVAEPTDLRVAAAHKGIIFTSFTTYGKATHGSTPWHGINAIYKMMSLAKSLQNMAATLRKRKHPLVGCSSMNLGRIEGGQQWNIVPAICKLQVDRRIIPGETFDDAMEEFKEMLAKLSKEDSKFKAEMTIDRLESPMECPLNSQIVGTLLKAHEKVTRRKFKAIGVPYWTDAAIMANPPLDIQTVVFGPGSIAQAHASIEWIEITQLIDATKILALTALDICSGIQKFS